MSPSLLGFQAIVTLAALRWNRKAQRAQADHEAQKEPPVMEFVVDSRFYSTARARAQRNDAALESAILPRKGACLAFSQVAPYIVQRDAF